MASSVNDRAKGRLHAAYMLRREALLAAAGIGFLLAAPAAAIGASQYPDGPIKIIVPFAAGGAVDTMARIVADKLTSEWKQPVIVANRVGFGRASPKLI